MFRTNIPAPNASNSGSSCTLSPTSATRYPMTTTVSEALALTTFRKSVMSIPSTAPIPSEPKISQVS